MRCWECSSILMIGQLTPGNSIRPVIKENEPVALYWPFVTFGGSHFGSDLAVLCCVVLFVEVSGLEPPTSTMRTSGSWRFDQGLSEDFPGGGVSIPSGSLTIPLLPSR